MLGADGQTGLTRSGARRRGVVVVEHGHRQRALAVGGAEAVGGGVAAADDDHVLAGGVDRRRGDVAGLHPVALRQVLHRLVDAAQRRARVVELAGAQRADRQHDRVEVAPQCGDVGRR